LVVVLCGGAMLASLVCRHAARWHFKTLLLPVKHSRACLHTSRSLTSRTVPQLTNLRYPNITRGNFESLSASDVEFFKKVLSDSGQVLTENDDLSSYNIDWMSSYRGIHSVFIVDKLYLVCLSKLVRMLYTYGTVQAKSHDRNEKWLVKFDADMRTWQWRWKTVELMPWRNSRCHVCCSLD